MYVPIRCGIPIAYRVVLDDLANTYYMSRASIVRQALMEFFIAHEGIIDADLYEDLFPDAFICEYED